MFKNKFSIILLMLPVFMWQLQAQTVTTIGIDFGDVLTDGWNNISDERTGSVENLIDTLGIETPIRLEISDTFSGINNAGTQAPDPSLGIPSTATEDSFYGHMQTWDTRDEPTGAVLLSNLDPETEYFITLFCSRDATDNRETQYNFTGSIQDSTWLDAASNTTEVAYWVGYPAADGTIEIAVTAGPENNNSYGFFYLGAMLIEYESEISGVETNDVAVHNFQLQQNYPNPFNPSTTIAYSITSPDFTSLAIYNMKGQKIRTLVHAMQSVGQHTVQWNGLTDTGEKAASGMYIYKLWTGSHNETRKMVLMQ